MKTAETSADAAALDPRPWHFVPVAGLPQLAEILNVSEVAAVTSERAQGIDPQLRPALRARSEGLVLPVPGIQAKGREDIVAVSLVIRRPSLCRHRRPTLLRRNLHLHLRLHP